MRSVFDQYKAKENQLTHALLSALDREKPLALAFLRWIRAPEPGKHPRFFQQSLPGDLAIPTEDEAEQRGLPDGVIYEPERYTVLIESKVSLEPTVKQLRAHLDTAEKKGYANPCVLLISVKSLKSQETPGWLRAISWSDVYVWLKKQPSSIWRNQIVQFMESAEARWTAEAYLKEGTLTTFAGIPFDNKDETYDYFQAKRLIRLMRSELIKSKALASLGADVASRGRPAITGRNSSQVWDMIPIKATPTGVPGEAFTRNVHLTFAILDDRLQAYVTIPNGIKASRRARILGQEIGDFERLVSKVNNGFRRVLRKEPKAKPALVVVQRQYASQRSEPEVNAELRFDLRTFFSETGGVKHQPQWLNAAYEAMKHPKSNLQMQIGMDFPYAGCKRVRSAEAITLVADTWEACRPLIEAARD